MDLNLSIKKVPAEIVTRIKERAKRNHRSLQGELLAILEETVAPRRISAEEVYLMVRELGLRTGSESASTVRENRDAR